MLTKHTVFAQAPTDQGYCADPKMDFSRVPDTLQTAVYWITIPMISLDMLLLAAMLRNNLKTRCKRAKRASLLTKVQFVILYIAVLMQIVQLAMYNVTTSDFAFETETGEAPAIFMFANCALGARFLYGIGIYFITLSAFLIGYR